MQRHGHLRSVLLVGLGFATGIGVLGFRVADRSEPRTGLAAYQPDAVEAVDPDHAGDADQHSNAEITVVMETRNVCRELYRYAHGDTLDADALETRLRTASGRVRAGATSEDESGGNIDQLVGMAISRVEAGRKLGSMEPVRDFVRTECDPRQDYSQPILTEGS